LICALKNIGRPQEECLILNQNENVFIPYYVDDATDDTDDDFELFLKAKSGGNCITTNIVLYLPLWNLLMGFKGSHMILMLLVRECRSLKKKEMPELYEISQVFMSIPATQVSLKNKVILYF